MLVYGGLILISTAIPADKRHLAFRTLFLTEMWEKFSNFGLRSLLVLYFVQSWHWSDQQSYAVFGVYVTLLCLTPVLGGYLSDRVLGRKMTTLVGACLILLGHVCISFLSDTQFMFGLINVIIGTGLMVPSMCSLVGLLYANDKSLTRSCFYLVLYGRKSGWHFSVGGSGVCGALVRMAYGFWFKRPSECSSRC